MTDRIKVVAVLGFLSVLVILSFAPILNNNFVNWDDNVYLFDNPLVKHLNWGAVYQVLTSYDRTQYSPLVFLSFAAQYNFFQVEPFGYHLVSLLLHLFNVWLVFWLFFLIKEDLWTAAGVALLFGVHPLRVESVAWVTEQKDLLYTLFFLWSFISYIFYKKLSKKWHYFLSLIFYLLSLLVKPMCIMLPFLLISWEILYNRPLRKTVLLDQAPFFTLMFLMLGINWMGFVWEAQTSVIGSSASSALYRMSFYIGKIFWPSGLSCVYPAMRNAIYPLAWSLAPLVVGLSFLLGFFVIKDRRSFVFGCLFFILILFPVLLPNGYFIVADRYVYVAGAGIFFCVVVAFRAFYARRCVARRFTRNLFFILIICGVVLMSFRTWKQSRVWHDGITLWSQAAGLYPENAVIRDNLSEAYANAKDYSNALHEGLHFLRLEASARSAVQVGSIYLFLKKDQLAENFFRSALRLDPGFAPAYNNLGSVYFNKRDPVNLEKALEYFNKAAQVAVGMSDNSIALIAYNNMCLTYLELKRYPEALRIIRQAVIMNPDSIKSRKLFLRTLISNKKFDEVFKEAEICLTMAPDDPWCNRAAAMLVGMTGLNEEAGAMVQKAERLEGLQ